ncbi:hypothetical protein V6N13_044977 [Hibiscus sabdariffa]|uniref:RNase H type-1 domain-containing protein n=1 Tax=Hibiscus sabdariffa TaxID=183260 RepID=A0ABR2RJQ6_9ROSI
MVTFWAIWYARNKMVHEGNVPSIAHTHSLLSWLSFEKMICAALKSVVGLQRSKDSDAFQAKALACLVAVNFARDLGFTRVVIEGDSLTVIKKCQLKNIDASLISPLIADIKEVSKFFVSVSYGFVHRETNDAVHLLAQEGKMYSSPMY